LAECVSRGADEERIVNRIGIGLLKGVSTVRWTTVRDMVLAWVVTLPASSLLSALAYYLLTLLA
jgi:PiT family inorganic phosphate transporter